MGKAAKGRSVLRAHYSLQGPGIALILATLEKVRRELRKPGGALASESRAVLHMLYEFSVARANADAVLDASARLEELVEHDEEPQATPRSNRPAKVSPGPRPGSNDEGRVTPKSLDAPRPAAMPEPLPASPATPARIQESQTAEPRPEISAMVAAFDQAPSATPAPPAEPAPKASPVRRSLMSMGQSVRLAPPEASAPRPVPSDVKSLSPAALASSSIAKMKEDGREL